MVRGAGFHEHSEVYITMDGEFVSVAQVDSTGSFEWAWGPVDQAFCPYSSAQVIVVVVDAAENPLASAEGQFC